MTIDDLVALISSSGAMDEVTRRQLVREITDGAAESVTPALLLTEHVRVIFARRRRRLRDDDVRSAHVDALLAHLAARPDRMVGLVTVSTERADVVVWLGPAEDEFIGGAVFPRSSS